MQSDSCHVNEDFLQCSIPDAGEPIFEDIVWGEVGRVFTPAFWWFVCATSGTTNRDPSYRLGETLEQEVVACLLGGHGITGELSDAAFAHLKASGVFEMEDPSQEDLRALLSKPLLVNGKSVLYRFPTQKARYIASALRLMRDQPQSMRMPREFRDWLITLPGVGLKTASWIVRNWWGSDDVAILDIHIHRAGVMAGLFSPSDDPVHQYHRMEDKFVRFASALGVPTSILDSVIWHRVRCAPRIVRRTLIDCGVQPTDRCGLPPAHEGRASRNYELFPNT